MLTTDLILGQGLSPPASVVPINSDALFTEQTSCDFTENTEQVLCLVGVGGAALRFSSILYGVTPPPPLRSLNLKLKKKIKTTVMQWS